MSKEQQSRKNSVLTDDMLGRNKMIQGEIFKYQNDFSSFLKRKKGKLFKKEGFKVKRNAEKKKFRYLEYTEQCLINQTRNIPIQKSSPRHKKTNLQPIKKNYTQKPEETGMNYEGKKSISSANIEKIKIMKEKISKGISLVKLIDKVETKNMLHLTKIHLDQGYKVHQNFEYIQKKIKKRNEEFMKKQQNKSKYPKYEYENNTKKILKVLDALHLKGKNKDIAK